VVKRRLEKVRVSGRAKKNDETCGYKKEQVMAVLRPWDLLATSLLLDRPPWVAVHQDSVRLPSQRVLDDFYRVILPDFAVVAAMTPAKELVMVRTYKHGLGRISLTAPAGFLEPGELPMIAAQRELLEETGYKAASWHSLGSFLTDGNRHCGMGHFFLARDAVPVSHGKRDDAEEVRVELLSPTKFLQAVHEGDIALLPTVSVLALALLTPDVNFC
jgi:ADP-ribose pyrophosphatase